MEVNKELPYEDYEEGQKGRKRKWFSIDEAKKYLKLNKID
jgi:hypothetical protein